MKNFIIALSVIFALSQVAYAQIMTCKQASKSEKPILVLYSADYCHYCKKFKPVFFHLSDSLSDKYSFVYYDITQKQKKSKCSNVDLYSIPTLVIITDSDKKYVISDKFYSHPELLKGELLKYSKNLK